MKNGNMIRIFVIDTISEAETRFRYEKHTKETNKNEPGSEDVKEYDDI